MYIDLCLSEDVTVSIEAASATITKDIIAFTASEDIAIDMAIIYLDTRTTIFIDFIQHTSLVVLVAFLHLTTSYGCNLTATKDAVTNLTAPYCYVCEVHTTVIIVSTTKEITTVRQTILTNVVCPCFIVQFLFVLTSLRIVGVTNVSVVHGQVSCTKDGATLTTAIGITLNGRYAFVEAIVAGQCLLVLTDANDDVCLA